MTLLDATTYLARHGAALVDRVRRSRPDLVDVWLARLDGGFLALQAQRVQSFDPCSRDLEEQVLPWLVERRDWLRFVRYHLVACNLRDLAEELDSPVLLRALTRDRLPFAVNLARRLPDRLRRARARAVLLGALDRSGRAHLAVYGELVEELRDDLAPPRGAPERTDAERICATLVTVVEESGLAVRRQWDDWLGLLESDPDLADRLRFAVAALLLDADPTDPEAWHHLAMVRDPDELVSFLRAHAAALAIEPPRRLLGRLLELDRGRGTLFWSAAPALLARDGPPAGELWRLATGLRPPPPWTPRLVAAGAPLWGRLPWRDLEEVASSLDDGETRAAFWVAVLAAGRQRALAPARAAVDALPAEGGPISCVLSLLESWPDPAAEERLRRLDRLGGRLAGLRFARPADELRRFLDLVAELRPAELERWVEDVLWAPESDAGVLLALARESSAEPVLEELLRHPERCAATVADDEAAAFELRLEVIVEAASRLCRRRGDASALSTTLERVLPDEEDGLRSAVATALAGAGREEAARAVCAGIRSRRLRRRVRLGLLPERAAAEGALSPADLYAALATVEGVEDELAALAALFELPVDPGEVARKHLEGIADPGRRLTALADLARHALRFDEMVHSRHYRDPLAALVPLRRALGVAESDRWLVRVTPELVELGAAAGPGRARVELDEAVERVLARTAVPWEERLEVLADLLARGAGLLAGEGWRSAGRTRFAGWIAALLRLPEEYPPGYVERDELRRHWHRLLPRVVAAAEAAPPEVARRLCHPSWARLGLARPASGIGPAVSRHRGRWTWLAGDEAEAVDVCAIKPDRRRALALRLRDRGEAPAAVVEALVVLLAGGDGELAVELVPLLAERWRRDALRLELARHPGLDRRYRLAFTAAIEDDDTARRARLWTATDEDVAPLADALAAGDVDVENPRCAPLRRRSWKSGVVPGALPTLAQAATAALRDGGAEPGLDALRTWLNARLAPEAGVPRNGETRRTIAALRRAVTGARSITADADASPGGDRDGDDPMNDGGGDEGRDAAETSTPGEAGTLAPTGPQRLATIARAWRRVWNRRPRLFASGRAEDDEGLALFLAICTSFSLLPPLDLALWRAAPDPAAGGGAADPELHPAGWLLLAVTALLNGLALGSYLAWRLPALHRRSRTVRILVSLVVSPPYWGLVLAGFHRHWLPHLVRRFAGGTVVPTSRRHRAGVARRTGLVGRTWYMAALLILNYVSVLPLVGLVPAHRPGTPWALAGFLAVVLVIHLATTLFLAASFRGRARLNSVRSVGRWAEPAFALSFLLPVPGLALSACLLMVILDDSVELAPDGLLGGGRRTPAQHRLEQRLSVARRSLRRWTSLDTTPASSRADRDLAQMAHLKVASLFFVAGHVGGRVEGLSDAVGWTALVVAASALAWTSVVFLHAAWTGRHRRPHHSAASYLAAVALTGAAGLHAGHALIAGDLGAASSAIGSTALVGVLVSFVCLVSHVFSGTPWRGEIQGKLNGVKTVAFACLTAWALTFGQESADPPPGLEPLRVLVAMSTLLVVVGASFCAPLKLTRPYGPRAALLGRVPPEDRVAAMFLAWTALLPGGGLAVPLWIPILRRRAERERRWLLCRFGRRD